MLSLDLHVYEILTITIAGKEKEWRLSKIDGKLVKYFDENGNYTQMPYESFKNLLEEGHVKMSSRSNLT